MEPTNRTVTPVSSSTNSKTPARAVQLANRNNDGEEEETKALVLVVLRLLVGQNELPSGNASKHNQARRKQLDGGFFSYRMVASLEKAKSD